jgi:hypothetical protein
MVLGYWMPHSVGLSLSRCNFCPFLSAKDQCHQNIAMLVAPHHVESFGDGPSIAYATPRTTFEVFEAQNEQGIVVR